MTSESDSSSIIKDSGSSTITHVDIKGGSRSGSESSHLILQDLQCHFRFNLFLFLVLVLVFVNESVTPFSFSFSLTKITH